MQIENIVEDFRSGLKLMLLLEVLSDKFIYSQFKIFISVLRCRSFQVSHWVDLSVEKCDYTKSQTLIKLWSLFKAKVYDLLASVQKVCSISFFKSVLFVLTLLNFDKN